MEKGDIVQITNNENEWYPCLLIVSEVKSFGIQGYVTVPKGGNAYIRLKESDYEKVGDAIIITT